MAPRNDSLVFGLLQTRNNKMLEEDDCLVSPCLDANFSGAILCLDESKYDIYIMITLYTNTHFYESTLQMNPIFAGFSDLH